jgi:hypothetical protein
LPETSEIPPNFLCALSGKIMSNPVRDRCVYRNNLKDREFGKEALQNFDAERVTIAQRQGASEHQNSEAKLTQPKTDSSGCFGIKEGHVFEKEAILKFLSQQLAPAGDALCPISGQVMPNIIRKCLNLNPGESEVVVTINNGLAGDVSLQREILAWLQNQVGPNREREIADLKDRCMKSFMQAFSLVPPSYQQEVYGHLCDIQQPAHFYDGMGAHSFHGYQGQSSTLEEKMEALRRCIQREEIAALEWMF